MEQRILDAIDIFLDAINNGELAKGSCFACAVGNIVRHYNGVKSSDWVSLFFTGETNQQKFYPQELQHRVPTAKEEISKTPFTEIELAAIEFAFETNTKIHYSVYKNYTKEEIKADQIKGLTAVIEVMKSFKPQENVDLDIQKVFTSKVVMT